MSVYNKKIINPHFLKFKMGCRNSEDDDISNINHKTRMCQNIIRLGTCQFGTNCHYAHTYEELRIMDCAYGCSCIFVKYEDGNCINDEEDRTKICYFRHPSETDDSYHCRIDNKKAKPSSVVNEDNLVPKQVDINTENTWSMVVSKTTQKHIREDNPPIASRKSENSFHILRTEYDNPHKEFSVNDRQSINEYIQECIDKKVKDVTFSLKF